MRQVVRFIISLPKAAGLGLLAFYQRFVSPLTSAHCRYYPTCSSYAKQAVQGYGFVLGSLMAVARLLRCVPWCRGGIDPVPERCLGFWRRDSLPWAGSVHLDSRRAAVTKTPALAGLVAGFGSEE